MGNPTNMHMPVLSNNACASAAFWRVRPDRPFSGGPGTPDFQDIDRDAVPCRMIAAHGGSGVGDADPLHRSWVIGRQPLAFDHGDPGHAEGFADARRPPRGPARGVPVRSPSAAGERPDRRRTE